DRDGSPPVSTRAPSGAGMARTLATMSRPSFESGTTSEKTCIRVVSPPMNDFRYVATPAACAGRWLAGTASSASYSAADEPGGGQVGQVAAGRQPQREEGRACQKQEGQDRPSDQQGPAHDSRRDPCPHAVALATIGSGAVVLDQAQPTRQRDPQPVHPGAEHG